MKTFVAVIFSCLAISVPAYSYTGGTQDTKLNTQTIQLMAKSCDKSSKNTKSLTEPSKTTETMLARSGSNQKY